MSHDFACAERGSVAFTLYYRNGVIEHRYRMAWKYSTQRHCSGMVIHPSPCLCVRAKARNVRGFGCMAMLGHATGQSRKTSACVDRRMCPQGALQGFFVNVSFHKEIRPSLLPHANKSCLEADVSSASSSLLSSKCACSTCTASWRTKDRA